MLEKEKWGGLPGQVEQALLDASNRSGIEFSVKSRHSNPGYLQFKVQYAGPLGRNWIKIDITPETPVGKVLEKPLTQAYSDYPDFTVSVESPEEILAQKLRALVERKKVRDYYDVWKLCGLQVDKAAVSGLFRKKLEIKGIPWNGLKDIFPVDIIETLKSYWERELVRLVQPVPDMDAVLKELKKELLWLE